MAKQEFTQVEQGDLYVLQALRPVAELADVPRGDGPLAGGRGARPGAAGDEGGVAVGDHQPGEARGLAAVHAPFLPLWALRYLGIGPLSPGQTYATCNGRLDGGARQTFVPGFVATTRFGPRSVRLRLL